MLYSLHHILQVLLALDRFQVLRRDFHTALGIAVAALIAFTFANLA